MQNASTTRICTAHSAGAAASALPNSAPHDVHGRPDGGMPALVIDRLDGIGETAPFTYCG